MSEHRGVCEWKFQAGVWTKVNDCEPATHRCPPELALLDVPVGQSLQPAAFIARIQQIKNNPAAAAFLPPQLANLSLNTPIAEGFIAAVQCILDVQGPTPQPDPPGTGAGD